MSASQEPVGRAMQRGGFLRRTFAMLVKEFLQLRRDRVSFAMIVMVPLMQLVMFGYAIKDTPERRRRGREPARCRCCPIRCGS